MGRYTPKALPKPQIQTPKLTSSQAGILSLLAPVRHVEAPENSVAEFAAALQTMTEAASSVDGSRRIVCLYGDAFPVGVTPEELKKAVARTRRCSIETNPPLAARSLRTFVSARQSGDAGSGRTDMVAPWLRRGDSHRFARNVCGT